MNNDFTGQIAAYKAAGCEIVTGVMIPPRLSPRSGARPRSRGSIRKW